VVNQKGQNLNVSGMSLVGLPLVVFGRNDSIAWAGTSMMADTQDLYFEKVHPFETNKYQDGDVWREFETRVEKIEIKSEMPAFINRKIKPVEVKLRSTVRGPVVSDVVQGFDFPISLSWTALQSIDTTYNGLYELSYAQNWDAFKAALGQMVAPTLNLLYVDNDDNIGFLGVGDIPIRKKGDGRYPVPGWEPEYRWRGMIPAEHMPASLNPEKGYIVSANNKIIDDSYPYFISHDWAPPSRARRIEQLLEQKLSDGLSMQDIQIMQADTMDLGMHEVVTQALEILGPQPGLDEVLSLLKNWDGDMSQNSVAGSIAYTWLEFLSGELFGDDLEDYWNSRYSNSINNINARLGYTNIRLALMDDSYDWCDNRLTEEQESCELPLKTALENTIKRLKKLKGGNMDNWQWGDLHFSVYDHTPLSQSRLFQSIFERRAVGGGSAGSINVSNAIFDESKGYAQHFGASFRQIIKMHQTDKAHLYMNSMGQSSHVMSEHYDDMVLPFASVQYYSMPNKANHSSQQILLLTPVDNQGN
jgi:penicillin amidase